MKAPRGVKDVLWDVCEIFEKIESIAKTIFEDYGYKQIRTPIFEPVELFVRSIGEASDIVSKQMYIFEDKKGRKLALRPEGTASVIRAYIENGLYNEVKPVKLYYSGVMFRYERPQAGRQRQFWQVGTEAIGSSSPLQDAEVLLMIRDFLKELGIINKIKLFINSIGCTNCQKEYKPIIVEYFGSLKEKLCQDCQIRLVKNPLRILDCKVKNCQEFISNSPSISKTLCRDCRIHFEKVLHYIELFNLSYIIDEKLVRGLDYYTRTIFEFIGEGISSDFAVCAGGRYDNLAKELGKDAPAIGFAAGVERLYILTKDILKSRFTTERIPVYIAFTGAEKTKEQSFILAQQLRHKKKIIIHTNLEEISLKSQLDRANKLNCKYTIIIGEDELMEGCCILRDMESGSQKKLPLTELMTLDFSMINL